MQAHGIARLPGDDVVRLAHPSVALAPQADSGGGGPIADSRRGPEIHDGVDFRDSVAGSAAEADLSSAYLLASPLVPARNIPI